MTLSQSQDAQKAYSLVRALQERFVTKLNKLSNTVGEKEEFQEVTWLRDKGEHGGGNRFEFRDEKLFNAASINVTQVHYEDLPDKKLNSITAISTIIHPKNPHLPSIHIHISLSELKDGNCYWRIMADLNPSIYNEHDHNVFKVALHNLSLDLYEKASLQGDTYFYIPALQRHRGVCHFYLEEYTSGDKAKDFAFVKEFGEGVIDVYVEIITDALKTRLSYSSKEIRAQLEYHTLYFFQVLTLDRGTTSGLLIHNQNDVGVMGSLPAYIDKNLLLSWAQNVHPPQNELIISVANAISIEGYINDPIKKQLAQIVRQHYTKFPEALQMQANIHSTP